MSAPLVLKFGGACFLSLDDFAVAARYCAERMRGGQPAVLVASAMSGTSGNVSELIRRLNPSAPSPLVAVAMGTADQLSAGLLAVALSAAGVRSCLLTFDRTGLVADGDAMDGTLRKLDGGPLTAALATCQAVVLPGGQGRDEAGRLVMLGRNSSDLSAVAAAVAAAAPVCEIFSEVPGVYSADPRLVPDARPIKRVPYQLATDMARCGAKILHREAVELAAAHNVRIVCRGRPPAATAVSEVCGAGQWQPAVVAAPASQGSDRSMLTVFVRQGEPPEQYLVPSAELAVAAREHHRRLYPRIEPSASLAVSAQPRRSPLSRILFHTDGTHSLSATVRRAW